MCYDCKGCVAGCVCFLTPAGRYCSPKSKQKVRTPRRGPHLLGGGGGGGASFAGWRGGGGAGTIMGALLAGGGGAGTIMAALPVGAGGGGTVAGVVASVVLLRGGGTIHFADVPTWVLSLLGVSSALALISSLAFPALRGLCPPRCVFCCLCECTLFLLPVLLGLELLRLRLLLHEWLRLRLLPREWLRLRFRGRAAVGTSCCECALL